MNVQSVPPSTIMNFQLSPEQADCLRLPTAHHLVRSEEYYFSTSTTTQSEQDVSRPEPTTLGQFLLAKLKLNPHFREAVASELELLYDIEHVTEFTPELDARIKAILRRGDSRRPTDYYEDLVASVVYRGTFTQLGRVKQLTESLLAKPIPEPKPPATNNPQKFSPRDRLNILKRIQKLDKHKYRRAYDLLKGGRSQKLSVEIRRIPQRILEQLVLLVGHDEPEHQQPAPEDPEPEPEEIEEESSSSSDSFTTSDGSI